MIEKNTVIKELQRFNLPDGRNLISADMVRAVTIKDAHVTFIIEAPDEKTAKKMESIRFAAENLIASLEGVQTARAILTAHVTSETRAKSPDMKKESPPDLNIGRHPSRSVSSAHKTPIENVKNIVAIASGKGGVGKSTLSANLAVSLARDGRKVGLLDADIYGPSQPIMMGVQQRPTSPDGKIINPLTAHGVKLMSIGLMVDARQAIVWRGPMLMGALQQMLHQVRWGELDILLIDLPPGTGDVQLTLCQRVALRGAIVVSTPQDIALSDARKAIDMFNRLNVTILGLVENMSYYTCPKCGDEAHIFGQDGVHAEAKTLGVPLLGTLPLARETMLSSEKGVPIAATDSAVAKGFHALASDMIDKNWA